MELYVLRHGIAEEGRSGQSDGDRALTAEGKRRLRRILKVARKAEVRPSLILTSPLKRAQQTAQLAAEELHYSGDLLETKVLLPSSDPKAAWEEFRLYREQDQLLIAGHEPLFSSLGAYLLNCPSLRIDFKKGTLLRIDFDDFGAQPHGTLKWMLVPRLAGA